MTTKKTLRVSVVINTADRAKYIGDTLRGLEQQTYDNFEVIVVNGPSQDNTEEVVKKFNIRYYTAPFNLSVSRNIGIKHAAGDVIAFIDDDAVPSPTWLEEIVQGYTKESVGAVGGWVYHVDSADYQFKYGAISMWGAPILKTEKDFDYNRARAEYYNINIGTNATYLRTHLVEVGGFDEEIEYYHDESDVCVRMINGGYSVVELEGAIVHHKMAPSSRRSSWKNVTNWDSVVKNGVYFAIKHSSGKASLPQRIMVPFSLHRQKYKLIFLAARHRQLNLLQFLYRFGSLTRAFARGYVRGFFQEPKLISGYHYDSKPFKQYKTPAMINHRRSTIVMVSQGFPPAATDGIARYNYTLAKQLSSAGYQVFVVSKATETLKGIRYVDGFWVHYHDPGTVLEQVTGYERLDNILALTKSVYNEVKKISEQTHIDVILAPLWDVEGLALTRLKIAPVIVTLMSPLKKVVETQWSSVVDPSIQTLYELEKIYIEQADGVMAISNAIKQTIGSDYNILWDKLDTPVDIVPLGVETSLFLPQSEDTRNSDTTKIELLYVGRFEYRKGIDLLLGVLPDLMDKYPELHVRLIGNASIKDENGNVIFQDFAKKYKKRKWFKRIRQDGYVSDKELAKAYASSDIFVAPSRYESFGLIFIEAMANAKPVIGTRVGGIPEIISDGVNGYLFESESTKQLQQRIEALLQDESLRQDMGKAGRQLIEEKFSAEAMTEGFLKLFEKVISRKL